MHISREYIDKAEQIMLPNGCHFDEERIAFINKMDSGDLLSVPGSGKTTVLRAKLYCMAQNLPLSDGRGIMALSHTNVAVEELRNELQSHCPQLFEYPNFVGTIQDFVDTFLALPFYVQSFRHKVDTIDEDRYIQECEYKMRHASSYLKNNIPFYTKLRYDYNEAGEKVLLTGLNGSVLEYPVAEKWKREGTVDQEVSKMRDVLVGMKNSIIRSGILHFDDCYFLANAYLRKYPSIVEILRKRFAYVFVDEAQDMQRHQLDIIDKCFHCDSVVLQRVGDPNQSIYDGFSTHNRWESRTPTFINNSLRLTNEIASIVDHLVLDRGNNGAGAPRFIVNGKRTINNPISPRLVLYEKGKMSGLKEKFKEIIRNLRLNDLPDARKYGFHIIGWNAIKSGDVVYRHLEDIFPEYNKTLTHLNIFPQSLSALLQQDKHIHSFAESRKSVLESFVIVLKEAGIKAPDSRLYSVSKLLTLLGEKDETVQERFKNELLSGVKLISLGCWEKAYDRIKELVTKWLNEYFGAAPNDRVNAFLGEEFDPVKEDPIVDGDDLDDIPISIGTVHSVKGMTHCATMYVETAHRKKYESQYMIQQISIGRGESKETQFISPLFKQDIDIATDTAAMVKRVLYVGLSRPTHLLCYASEKCLWDEDKLLKMAEAGWIIEEV